MANRDIVAIGTSAGGFEALCFLANEFERKAAVLRECDRPPRPRGTERVRTPQSITLPGRAQKRESEQSRALIV
jgi:hypothetical protein